MKQEEKILTPVERYLEHFNSIFQVEPEFYRNESTIEGYPGVSTIVYRNIPEEGMITAVTYGLSLVKHLDWKFGRPELMISVESTDEGWARVAGFLANSLRSHCPFAYGNTIDFKELIANDSEMDAFLIFAPSIIDRSNYLDLDIGLDYKINVAGLYPIYSSEMDIILNVGLEKFWKHPEFDIYNVNRNRIQL